MGYQQVGIKANKYLYQEKEFQDGLNLNIYDLHARGYDPAIGRTMQMDPHAENYLDLSPYSWGANNPISIIDPTGMDTVNYNNVDWKNFKTDTDVLGLDEVVFTFGSGNYPSLSDINGQNQKAMSGWVDAAQMGLDVIGMTEIPFVSQGAELVSAGISFGRGDTFGGLIGLGSMIPILGKTFEATKIARYAAKGLGKFAKIPPGKMTKLKNGQGWMDESGNIWKKDMKHKDHWDISDPKTGKKVKEIDFDGNQIWPDGPKNKNKR